MSRVRRRRVASWKLPELGRQVGKILARCTRGALLFSKAQRWDVKGKRYFSYPAKYYAIDVGRRNARLNFRQVEETHLMENVIYSELAMRGCSVDVDTVRFAQTRDGREVDAMREIDYVVNRRADKLCI